MANPITELERLVSQAGSQKKAAAELGVSQQYINDILRGYRDPGPLILERLGLEKVITYRAVK